VSDHEHVRTERLQLDAVTDADLDDMHALSSDPAFWQHDPSGRHTDPVTTAAQLHGFVAAWDRDALGCWAVRLPEDGRFVGVGGATVRSGHVWNLYHRLAPDAQEQGYADELVAAARAAATDVRPELPIVAYLLEDDEPARKVAERAGLQLVWRGPDAGNTDPGAVRLVFADRDLSPDELDSLKH
jgi:RimJ/RimL family protein N-acetyltransferase